MKKYTCTICGFVYDEAAGMPDAGIAPGTKWADLPSDWVCPWCGASKDEFETDATIEESTPTSAAPASIEYPNIATEDPNNIRELSSREASILCSNLARGCEKQYKQEEQALFTQLAEYFELAAAPVQDASFDLLLARIEDNLSDNIPAARAAASDASDRGALRALTWAEKVTRILKSLLTRYEKEGASMFEKTGVYVCTICGFIYVGETAPELCPVCKVPSWKFKKIEAEGGVL